MPEQIYKGYRSEIKVLVEDGLLLIQVTGQLGEQQGKGGRAGDNERTGYRFRHQTAD